jgi:chorismate dehydratase
MEVKRTADGSPTCYSPEYGEHFHSLSGAVLEARERYAAACGIRELAGSGSVAVLDIGFGLGYNLAAAIEAAGGLAGSTRLMCISLEKDPAVVKFVRDFDGPQAFSEIYPAVRLLAKYGRYTSGDIDLSLALGPAEDSIRELPAQPLFDAVFLDPFSPPVNGELWSKEFFREIARRVKPHAVLSTYSSATHVKLSLLGAGFKIGKGAKVGDKGSGTLASLDADLPPLPERERKKLQKRL